MPRVTGREVDAVPERVLLAVDDLHLTSACRPGTPKCGAPAVQVADCPRPARLRGPTGRSLPGTPRKPISSASGRRLDSCWVVDTRPLVYRTVLCDCISRLPHPTLVEQATLSTALGPSLTQERTERAL